MTTNFRCGRVALIGPPNAGKSTLTNALVGQKVAIVTPKAQTTRNKIVGILTEKDAQVIFIDTPGIYNVRTGHTRGQLAKVMQQAAWQSFNEADAVLLVLDGDLYIRKPELLEKDLEPLLPALGDAGAIPAKPLIVAINKIDLFHDKSRLLPLLTTLHKLLPRADLFPLSARRRDGLTNLLDLIKNMLPNALALYPADQLSTASLRFMAAEVVREKLFERLHQEVPYSVAVEIEKWEEADDSHPTTIYAAINVARDSHKAMVIGKAGASIKEIGTLARKDIQDLMGQKVHLELWVKVRDNWLDDPSFLQELLNSAEEIH